MSYNKILGIIEALEDKRLIKDQYYKDGLCCVIGAINPKAASRITNNSDTIRRILTLPVDDAERDIGISILVEAELTKDEASHLQTLNDGAGPTPEARYTRVVSWLKEQIAKEGSNASAIGNAQEVDASRGTPQS